MPPEASSSKKDLERSEERDGGAVLKPIH